jgi:hypothetical protein
MWLPVRLLPVDEAIEDSLQDIPKAANIALLWCDGNTKKISLQL